MKIIRIAAILFVILSVPAAQPMAGLRQAIRRACPTKPTVVPSAAKSVVLQRNWFPTLNQPSRSLFYTSKFKGAYQELPPSLKDVAPLHGEVAYRMPLLKNIYQYGTETQPTTMLSKKLFHAQESQFRPTQSKSQPAYSLTPSLVGTIMAALQQGTLTNVEVQKKINEQWRNEHKKLAGDKISEKKIADILDLINKSYQTDPVATRSIMLGFLTAKAENQEDILKYLYSIAAQTPGITQADSDRFKNLFATVYPLQEHGEFGSALVKNPESKNIENVLCAQLHNYFGVYPPQVMQCSYGYKNQSIRPNCVETALQDLFNIILFNTETKTFDFSLLPSTVHVRPEFKQFYQMQQFDPLMVNDKKVGQAWMDLVSNHDFLRYESNKDYELSGIATTDNFLALANYFLGLQAQDFQELGKQLSTQNRTITFNLQKNADEKTVTMTIRDRENYSTRTAELHAKPGHGWLTAPQRTQRQNVPYETSEAIGHKAEMGTEQERYAAVPLLTYTGYDSTKKMRREKVSERDYCAFDFNNFWEFGNVLQDALPRIGHNPELKEFAYTVLKQFGNKSSIHANYAIAAVVKSDAWQVDDRYVSFLLQHPEETFAQMLINRKGLNAITQQILRDFPQSIATHRELGLACQFASAQMVRELLNIGASKYVNSTNSIWGNPLLQVIKSYSQDKIAIVRELLQYGADPKVSGSYNLLSKLLLENYYSVESFRNNVALLELLLQHGADPNDRGKGNEPLIISAIKKSASSSLWIPEKEAQKEWLRVIDLLLKHGADPNVSLSIGADSLIGDTPLHFIAREVPGPTSWIGNVTTKLSNFIFGAESYWIQLTELLLKYGADVNAENWDEKRPVDYTKNPTLIELLTPKTA